MSFGHVTMTQHDDNDASHVAVKYLLGNDFIYYRIKRLRNIHGQCRDEVTQDQHKVARLGVCMLVKQHEFVPLHQLESCTFQC